jgi:uncharacterized membrane-anchored protein
MKLRVFTYSKYVGLRISSQDENVYDSNGVNYAFNIANTVSKQQKTKNGIKMMLEDFVKRVLTDQQRAAGLYLEEPDDHVVILKQASKVRAVFSQMGTTKDSIRAEADRWMIEPADIFYFNWEA